MYTVVFLQQMDVFCSLVGGDLGFPNRERKCQEAKQNLLFSAKVKDVGFEAGNERYGPLCSAAIFLVTCSRQNQLVSYEETHAAL